MTTPSENGNNYRLMGFRFEKQVNIGTLVMILGVIVSMWQWFDSLSDAIQAQENNIATQSIRINSIMENQKESSASAERQRDKLAQAQAQTNNHMDEITKETDRRLNEFDGRIRSIEQQAAVTSATLPQINQALRDQSRKIDEVLDMIAVRNRSDRDEP